MAVFHSISAFCNAGFDLMGTHSGAFSSLTAYNNNALIVLPISFLKSLPSQKPISSIGWISLGFCPLRTSPPSLTINSPLHKHKKGRS